MLYSFHNWIMLNLPLEASFRLFPLWNRIYRKFFSWRREKTFLCIRMRKTFRKTTICHISAFNFSFIEVQDGTLLNLMSLSTVRQLVRSRFLHGHIFSIWSSFSFVQGNRTTSSVSKLAREGVMGMLGKEKTYWYWNGRVNNDTHDSQG